MYYFRDCYFHQQVAFGVTHASLARPPRKRTAPRRTQGKALDLILPFVCIGVTFYAGLTALDMLGLEHLVETPSFDLAGTYVEVARSFVEDAAAKLPGLVWG